MWETTSNGPTDHLWFMFLFRTYCRKWNDWDLPFLSFAFSNLWLMEDSRLLLESVTAFSTPGRGGREYGRKQPSTEEIWKQTWTGLGLLTVISFLCALGGFALTELFTESWQEPCNAVCLQALWCIEKRRSSRGAACTLTWEPCGKLTSGWCLLRSPNM